MAPADFLSIDDVTNDELAWLIERGDEYAREDRRDPPDDGATLSGPQRDRYYVTLPGPRRPVAMLFEKPSLRTKVSFDIAVRELGGHPIYLGADEVGLDTREPVEDVARVLEQWCAVIIARVMRHSTLERLAATASVPVVNALSDVEHPCQAVADLLTIQQHSKRGVARLKIAYIGDANNCALSLGLGAVALGARFVCASPEGYGFSGSDAAKLRARAANANEEARENPKARRGSLRREATSHVQLTQSPAEAATEADVLYTDVWTSMGQEAESAQRRAAFQGYQIDERLVSLANAGALLMHPMPAHYGEEMAPGMLEHPQSAAFQQAGNRLHAQKAILRLLIGGAGA